MEPIRYLYNGNYEVNKSVKVLTNKEIFRILNQTASLLELYGDNPYKIRSYRSAVYNLEREQQDLTKLTKEQLSEISGVGKSIAATIEEINTTGTSTTYENLMAQTPAGILELLKLKGIGARKIKTAWDELGIETPKDLYLAARAGRLAELAGFGEKTQEKVLQVLDYYQENKDLKHYKDAHLWGLQLEEKVSANFVGADFMRSGLFRRREEVIDSLEYLWSCESIGKAEAFLDGLPELKKDPTTSGPFRWRGRLKDAGIPLDVRFCRPGEAGSKWVLHTGSEHHLAINNDQGKNLRQLTEIAYEREEELYQVMGWPLVPPELREGRFESDYLKRKKLPDLVTPEHLKGILHNHSTFSDGKHSLQEMAGQCKALGYQYFGISDHSQTAVYANGLDETRILEQHQLIDELNKELSPFKIFKGIESDILNDGSLDYPDAVLQTFDFVVASIHSNLGMDEQAATQRLIKAVSNPYTTILGHPTGRQLLKREGYPVDHKKVIDACAEFGVAIEINAHPWRLDLEWKWVHYALQQGIMISINPDAHEKAGLEDVYYGVAVARKAALTPEMTLNALSIKDIERYFQERKKRALAISSV